MCKKRFRQTEILNKMRKLIIFLILFLSSNVNANTTKKSFEDIPNLDERMKSFQLFQCKCILDKLPSSSCAAFQKKSFLAKTKCKIKFKELRDKIRPK